MIGKITMIRILLHDMLSKKCFLEGRRIDWGDVAAATGIHRVTLSKMLNLRGYNATLSILDKLCAYFACNVGDLMTYVPDDTLAGDIRKSAKGPAANSVAALAGTRARYAGAPAKKLSTETPTKKQLSKRPFPSGKSR
jgi:putative transcriptional regulator